MSYNLFQPKMQNLVIEIVSLETLGHGSDPHPHSHTC
jgi:hypothetical protein